MKLLSNQIVGEFKYDLKKRKNLDEYFRIEYAILNLKKMKNLVLFCFLLTIQQLAAQENPTIKGKLEFKIHQKIESSEIVKVNNENKVERIVSRNDKLELKGDPSKKELHLRPHFDLKKEGRARDSKNERLKQQRENREKSKEHRHDRKEKNKD